MARKSSTTPSRPEVSPKTSGNGSASILSFFAKTPTPKLRPAATEQCKVEARDPRAERGSGSKARAKGDSFGSELDPVVISDDEDVVSLPPLASQAKRRKVQTCPTSPPREKSAFPAYPDFKPPETWPNVINVGSTGDDDDEEEGIPPSDEDGNGDQDPMPGDDGENDDSGIELDDVKELPLPVPESMAAVPAQEPLAREVDGDIEMDGGWEDPEDEGMGMDEDDGDDEGSVVSESVKRSSRCPVCGLSLKEGSAAPHINSCLDSSSSKKKRPISSYASFSPAASPSPEPEVTKGPNAFSVLMSGHKEKAQWKDAEQDLRRDGKRFIGRRKAPFYKVMTGMPVAVDAFRYGAIPKVTAYLLTWTHGPIYCSETTANLIVHMLGVEPKWVHGLPDNVPFVMPNTGGVTVMPIEANHCPGSSIFLFEGPQTVNAGDSDIKSPFVGSKKIFRYLHCGDFRACPKMVLHPAIARAPIHTCYLDTTYLNPKYCFPPQPQVINACAALARRAVVGISATAPPMEDIKPVMNVKLEEGQELKPHTEEIEERSKTMMAGWLVKKEDDDVKEELQDVNELKPKGRTLVVMGTYSIGKERIVKALGSTIYCDPRKKGILLCQTDPELHSLLSTDPIASQVHLLPLGNIQLDRLQPYLARLHPHFDRVMSFRPTGWTYTPPAGTDLLPDVNSVIKRDQARWFSERDLKPMRGSCRQFQMFGVPYSEHSSFTELTCFALSMPGADLKMIATVNVGNEKSRAKMKKWFEKWAAEKARRREKGLPQIVDYRDETYW
ncbi:hypothetical protein IAU60_005047 [Kwoniella sp. DSM 27419]